MRKKSLDCVYELSKINENVIYIGSDLGAGTLDSMKETYPKRFFMEGISEQHIIGMAAGLALEGYLPYVNTIGTFLTRRCYEQLVLDLCLQNLPVTLIGNGGGAVYAPLGPTHLSVEDIAILRTLPNMSIISPSDANEMEHLMKQTIDIKGPLYVRLGKGGDKVISDKVSNFKIGKGIIYNEPGEVTIISTGVMTQIALDVAQLLNKDNINCGVVHFHTLKPLDKDLIRSIQNKSKLYVAIEEHFLNGGFSSNILELCNDEEINLGKIERIGIPDEFAKYYGSQNSLLDKWNIEKNKIYLRIKSLLQNVR